ncbi:MAG: hypothetical protein QOG96_1083, partial [Pseudonocardiales bacterium]|nr:hypothetical protein [Pseudonocardiales bacterium]
LNKTPGERVVPFSAPGVELEAEPAALLRTDDPFEVAVRN